MANEPVILYRMTKHWQGYKDSSRLVLLHVRPTAKAHNVF